MAAPKIKIIRTYSDKIADNLSLRILIFSWVFLLIIYSKMPETVPIHLDGFGKADGFANKISLFLNPVIISIIYVSFTYLNKFPHIFNYPVIINEENAVHYYTIGTRMIRYLKLSVMIVFLIIQFEIILIAKNFETSFGVWSLIIPLAIILIPTLFFIIKSFAIQKSSRTK